MVDFSDGLNYYPDLTLLDNCPGQWERSRAMIVGVFDKMARMGARDAVFTLTRPSEVYMTREEAEESFYRIINELSVLAAEREIVIHLQYHPHRPGASAEELIDFVIRLDQPNVRYCLNTGHLLAWRDREGNAADPLEQLRRSGDLCDMVLLSAPYVDASGLVYDAHLPVAYSPYAVEVAALARRAATERDRTLILDIVTDDLDAEYRDAQLLL